MKTKVDILRIGHCRRLVTPVPAVGRQFVFDLPADVEAKVLATLRAQE